MASSVCVCGCEHLDPLPGAETLQRLGADPCRVLLSLALSCDSPAGLGVSPWDAVAMEP